MKNSYFFDDFLEILSLDDMMILNRNLENSEYTTESLKNLVQYQNK